MTTHEQLADTEARHAHRDLLAEKDADIERLTALVDALTDAVEHERNMPCQDMNLQQQAAQAVDDALARIKEPRNDQ